LNTPIDFTTLPDSAMIRQRDLLRVVGISATSIWRRCAAGTFPKPIKLGEKTTAWRWGDVRKWLEEVAA